ncbi:hypothetical protein EIP91_008311, partial [Steccherinum ochraceum]
MPDEPLIVPVAVPSGSLYFATITPDGTAEDVIQALLLNEEATEDVLGDLQPFGWVLQRIRREHNGRQWEEEELESLGNGMVPSSTTIAPLLNATKPTASSNRHFSAFPLTSHLHTPTLRLVSLHPSLSLTISFLRTPEVHDGFEYKVFFGRTSTVRNAIDQVTEELGLTKSLPVPGGGALEYVLEEVWSDGDAEKCARLSADAILCEVVDRPTKLNPFTTAAIRTFRFCVPDEWYRRSKSRSTSSASYEPSEDTVRRLASLEESDEESEDGDGTAKLKESSPSPSKSTFSAPADWRSSLSQSRLSTMFDSWIHPTAVVDPPSTPTPEKKVVSEPKLMEQRTGDSQSIVVRNADDDEAAEFEQMLDDLGFRGAKRDTMYKLPPEQRRYLIERNTESRASTLSKSSTSKLAGNHAQQASTYSPASGSGITRLVPQLTGDSSIMKRFSIVGWGGSGSPPFGSPRSSTDFDSIRRDSFSKGNPSPVADAQPLQPQGTGGLWSSWWASSGGEKGTANSKSSDKEIEKTPQWYVDGIKNSRSMDMKLVKHLISLRVHLSTATLTWVELFVSECQGFDGLGNLLGGLVAKGGKRKRLQEIEETVLLEVIKCIRVLLNTDPGFNYGISDATLIAHIAYSLHGASTKLRALASDVLAAICYVSPTDGHKAVLAALSDYRVEFDERFRFQELISSLRIPDTDDGQQGDINIYANDDDGVWEARSASMALINALTNFPDSLEDRISLREEFTRRGLNEAIVALRYIRPPDSLVTQLDIYTEEKFEDEEDMRERNLSKHRSASESEAGLGELIHAAKQQDDLYAALLETLTHLRHVLESDFEAHHKLDVVSVASKFLEHLPALADFDQGWLTFVHDFGQSIQYLTGMDLEAKASTEGHDAVIEEEIESLRAQIDELSQERSALRDEMSQQTAEITTLRALTSSIAVPTTTARPAGRGGPESTNNFHGLVQRLVLKEKQVLQLQSELDRLKSLHPNEDREAEERAKRERDRVKWNALNEEIAKLKVQIADVEGATGVKDKEIVYLKRALESVYSRFRLREENRGEAELDAQMMATRAIETLTQKDNELIALRLEVEDLKKQLAAKPKFITEKDFKSHVPPPPPPP